MSDKKQMMGEKKVRFPVSSNESGSKQDSERTEDRPKKEPEGKERRMGNAPQLSSSTPVYPRLLNRQLEMQRIKKENEAMRKRIEATKPTLGLRRAEQLADFNQQAKYRTAPSPGPSNFTELPSAGYLEPGRQEEMIKEKEEMRGQDQFSVSSNESGRKQDSERTEDRPKTEPEGKERRMRNAPQLSSGTRVYPRLLNRQLEMQRIEKENQAMRKWIEAAKPTQPVRRAEQLADFNRQAKYRTAPPPGPSKFAERLSAGYLEPGRQEEMIKEKEEMRGQDQFSVSSNESGRKQDSERTEDRPKTETEGKERRMRNAPQLSSSTRVYPRLLNRELEMQRIKMENEAMRKRIEAVKTTRPLRRAEQLADFDRQVKYRTAPPPGPSKFAERLSAGYLEPGRQEEMIKEKEEMRGQEQFSVSSNESGRKQDSERTEDRPKTEPEGKERRMRNAPQLSSGTRVYPRLLNRQLEMQRIEKENEAMRKWIEAAKPTQPVRRAEQLADFNRQAKYRTAPPPGPSKFAERLSAGYLEPGRQEEMIKEKEEMRGQDQFSVSSNESGRKQDSERTEDRPKTEPEGKERRMRNAPQISSSTRVYPTLLNRELEMQRIKMENEAMRKRIEATKPTLGLRRAEQLADFDRQAKDRTAPSPGPSNFTERLSAGYLEPGRQDEMIKEKEEMRGQDQFSVSSNESGRKQDSERTEDRPKTETEGKERRIGSAPQLSSSTPVYPRTLNKELEMQRIKMENEAIRKRIEARKLTAALRRAEQLSDFNQQAKDRTSPPPGPSNFTERLSAGYLEPGRQEEMIKEKEEMRGQDQFSVSSNESGRKQDSERTEDRPKTEPEGKERRMRNAPQLSSGTRVYPRLLNRQLEMQRIKKENQAMRKWIEAAKPTRPVRRAEQLADFNRQVKYRTAPPPGPSNFTERPSAAYYNLIAKSLNTRARLG